MFWFSFVYFSTRMQGRYLKIITGFQLPGGSNYCLGIIIMR
jgi:hypothetical protein